MFRKSLLGAAAMVALASGAALAQETKKEVIVNSDGSYTVIEYPVGKEVVVNLTPASTLATAKGTARVVRSADGTKVYFDMSDLPATVTGYHAYAIDPAGMVTHLGPVTVTNGAARAEFTTPMNQFMLAVSPMEGLTAISPANTVFTSAIPTGYAVVPKRVSENRTAQVAGDVRFKYDVPLLNISTFPDTEREIKMKFDGQLSGLEGKAYIDREDGTTKIRMHFDDMKKVPAGKKFVLWTVAPTGEYVKVGQIVNSGQRDEAEIKSETSLTDFGLFITVEETEVMVPTSRTYTVFRAS
ncbi:MAG: hypothetical protein PSX80_01735 [bacterium]|nr:hypothetical protein [bacterium]